MSTKLPALSVVQPSIYVAPNSESQNFKLIPVKLNFSIFVWFPMKIDMYLPCMLQNKVCLEHMLKMAPSSLQALLYASQQNGEDI
jgi:hypothetical protein